MACGRCRRGLRRLLPLSGRRFRSQVAVVASLVSLAIFCGVSARSLLDTWFCIPVSSLASKGPLRLKTHDTFVFLKFQGACGNEAQAWLETSAKGALKQTRCSLHFRFTSFWRAAVRKNVATKAPGCRHQRRLGQDPPSEIHSACRADAIAARPDFRGHRHAEETLSRMSASSLSLVIFWAKR